jgi:secreted trypsin-like serine protease
MRGCAILIAALMSSVTVACSTPASAPKSACAAAALVDAIDDDNDAPVVALGTPDHVACSGTIIAPRAVVTAAHCLIGSAPKYVLVGPDPHSAMLIATVAAILDPSFVRTTLSNDVGILILATDAPVPAADLADSAEAPQAGDQLVLVGYGNAVPHDQSDGLRKRSGTMRVDRIDDDLIHAFPDPATACSHDSGGAAFFGDSLAGIVSGGDVDCRSFTDLARVDTHRQFIEAALSSLPGAPCSPPGR